MKFQKGHIPWSKGKPSKYKGIPRSESTKKKISQSHLGMRPNDITRLKMSFAKKGKIGNRRNHKASTETRLKLRLSHLGKKSSHFGFKHSDEARQKMREKRKHQIIPRKDTKPERLLQQALTAEQIQFETHYPITGQPDIFIKPNICIFVDGDYWHNLENVKKHDVIVTETLEKANYIVLRFWEHEIYEEIRNVILRIVDKI